jgi:hypothetical protein
MPGQCHKAQGNRRIEVSHALRAYRKKAGEMPASGEGLFHRSRRPVEPEAVFGQMKAGKHCHVLNTVDIQNQEKYVKK